MERGNVQAERSAGNNVQSGEQWSDLSHVGVTRIASVDRRSYHFGIFAEGSEINIADK